MRFAAPLGLAVMATTTADAYGSEVSQRARLVYALDASAIPDCPDATALRKAVGDRLGYDPFWDWAQRTIVVQVRRDHGGYVARVVKVDPAGRSVTRDFPPDEDCHQVIAAAALAISIALDIAPSRAPSHAAEPESPQPAAVNSGPQPERVSAEAPALSPSSATPPGTPWFAVGGGLSAFAGIAPRPGGSAFAFAEFRRRAVSIAGELQVSTVVAVDQLKVELGTAGIVPCVRFAPTFVCAVGELGWMQTWTSGGGSDGPYGAPFVALGGRAGVEVALSAQAFVRLQGDFLVEAYGPRFAVPEPVYQTAGTAYKAPPTSIMSSMIGGALGLAAGVYFP